MTARLAASVTRWWTRCYTAGLPADVRDARRAEIESDLWESLRAGDTSREMFARLALGAVDDLSWSAMAMDASTRVTATLSMGSLLAVGSAGLAFAFLPVAVTMRESLWAFPVATLLHLAGLALFLGVQLALDLRLTGWGFKGIAPSVMVRRVTPWSLLGAVVTTISGMALYAAEPAMLATNPAFQIKMAALVLALLNAGVFHWALARSAAAWDVIGAPPRAVRASSYLSLILLWGVVPIAGRLIPFVGA